MQFSAFSSGTSTASVVSQPPHFFRRKTSYISLDSANSPQEIKALILDHLEKQAAVYGRAATFNVAFAHGSTLLIVVLGLIAAIMGALSWAANTPVSWQAVFFPACCSVLAALNLQFQFEKLARTREMCRIAIEELKCKAFLIPTDDMEEALHAAIELLESVYQLEREQVAETLPGRTYGDAGDGQTP